MSSGQLTTVFTGLAILGFVLNIALLVAVAVRRPPTPNAATMAIGGLALLLIARVTHIPINALELLGGDWVLIIGALITTVLSWAGIGLLVLAAYQSGRRDVDPAPPFST